MVLFEYLLHPLFRITSSIELLVYWTLICNWKNHLTKHFRDLNKGTPLRSVKTTQGTEIRHGGSKSIQRTFTYINRGSLDLVSSPFTGFRCVWLHFCWVSHKEEVFTSHRIIIIIFMVKRSFETKILYVPRMTLTIFRVYSGSHTTPSSYCLVK